MPCDQRPYNTPRAVETCSQRKLIGVYGKIVGAIGAGLSVIIYLLLTQ